jgi:CHAD domain-containing protein
MRRLEKRGWHLDRASDAALHALRKEAKKLRYASEFFAGYFQGKKQRHRHARFVRSLEKLQDQLGSLNDLATAPLVLGELGLGDDPDAAALRDTAGRDRLISRAGRAYEKLVDARRFWT